MMYLLFFLGICIPLSIGDTVSSWGDRNCIQQHRYTFYILYDTRSALIKEICIVAHCWIMWWLIVGDVVPHCWSCGASLLEMWWLIVGDVVPHGWNCGASLLEMWWLIVGDVVPHCWRCGGSLL